MVRENTYWNHNGKHQKICKLLEQKVPSSGQVNEPIKNKALEKFRKASNCYYDLYNNGLCNRAAEFRKVFGIASSRYGNYNNFANELYDLVEQRMDEIIEQAAKEQNIDLI